MQVWVWKAPSAIKHSWFVFQFDTQLRTWESFLAGGAGLTLTCQPILGLLQNFYSFRKFRTLQWSSSEGGTGQCRDKRCVNAWEAAKSRGGSSGTKKNHHPPPSQGRAPCRGKAASASKVSAVGQGDGQGPISTCQPHRRSIAWCWSRSRREINKTLKRHYSGWANRNTQVSKQQIKVLQFPLSQKLTLTFSPGNFLVCRSCIFPLKKINK